MKISKLLSGGAIGLSMIASSGAALAADPVSVDVYARANILKKIEVTPGSELNFATVIVGSTGDKITVGTDGQRTCGDSPATSKIACAGTASAASFDISGTIDEVVTVDVDNSVTLKNSAGDQMTAALSHDVTDGEMTLTGEDSFNVGGVLDVSGSQPSGAYSGQYQVTVEYK